MPLTLWRLVTGPHTIWSGEGARRHGARWNPKGLAAIYTASSFAGGLLEVLVHANRKAPPSATRFVKADVPDSVSREFFDSGTLTGWDDPLDATLAQAFGKDWIEQKRSAILIVPSVVTSGYDLNVVVNPDHPDFGDILAGPETPVTLDPRFFGR